MVAIISIFRDAWRANGRTKRRLLAGREKKLKQFLASDDRHSFPKVTVPRATLIIPVYNQACHTLECLMSLLDAGGEWLEVMVWDDGSSDETTAVLARFKNLRVCNSPANQGFLRSCNAAVKEARGEMVLLMNNDARLIEGSISGALDDFKREKNCGLMGARISLASGGLQEAGAMIFADGGTYGYLRHRPVDDPRALIKRDVDYCSGVFLIFERDTFLNMDGFDEIYAPAYYEETDFALRVWQNAMRCVYNPKILIEHFEFGSRPNARKRAQISRNRKIFLERWRGVLTAAGHLRGFRLFNEKKAALRRG